MSESGLAVDPQGRNMGIMLKTRRQEHQVSITQMIDRAGPGYSILVTAAEAYASPPMDSVRQWYSTLILLVGMKVSWQKQPYAQRNQWYCTDADLVLRTVAQELSPGVHWWWGQVKAMAPRGAWCYLCRAMICTYDVSSLMSHPARAAVMAHRALHVIGSHPDDRTDQEGTD